MLALRAGPATATCPTTQRTIIAIGTTYQASGVSEKACTMNIFRPIASAPPTSMPTVLTMKFSTMK